MRTLKLTLAYDGTEFHGWQVQPEKTTVQGTLAQAIGRLTGENVLPQGSGRTDAGVHAQGQVATFETSATIPIESFRRALNGVLPPTVRITDVVEVPGDFHARKSARAKTYRYRMYREEVCPPFVARYVWHYPYPLDENAMIDAAGEVSGEHDFTSFAAIDPERTGRADLRETRSAGKQVSRFHGADVSVDVGASNVRTILESRWQRIGDELIYTVRGNGFLHHMVRNLIGTFVLVGKGTLQVADIGRILEARNRSAAGATAPASGLCLMNVEY